MQNESQKAKNVYAADWAPKDPRDKLFDENASPSEKVFSIFRVIGAFHPVLNIFILACDSIRKLGTSRAALLWGFLSVAIYGVYYWFSD